MRFPSRATTTTELPGVVGPACADRRLNAVLRRASPGDVVVIDRIDLDRDSAEALLARGVAAVVNASPFISGRFPNLGPEVLARAGVPLVDAVGPEVFAGLKDGTRLRVHDGTVYAATEPIAVGRPLDLADVHALMDDARHGLATQLQNLTHHTTELLRREEDLLLHGLGLPALEVRMAGRPVVVVVRDFDHERDLRRLRRFIKEQHPVLIGVDAGADTLLAARLRPDVLVLGPGGLAGAGARADRVVSDRALTQAGEVVLHADASDRLPGAERLDRLGVRVHRVTAGAATDDVALLLADAHDASLVVTVGTHATFEELLDRHRSGMASAFLTRMRVGPRLVDAGTVPTLYSGRVRLWQLVLVLLVGLLALALAVASTPRGATWFDTLGAEVAPVVERLRGALP